ncbi:MAG: hypothetical protein COU71_02400 [Parcubacteria group bacterium CG10_big_fil_rev_8_21_14_0_10_38_31]|nr:MAG: hypothetical protein COU71_02400 [Parcubacteria group bacterium CG10_big_fil_rev_8_21_14_0_10_38_31]
MEKKSIGMADCNKCPSRAKLCVVKTSAGAFIVQPAVNGKRVCLPVLKKGHLIAHSEEECLGGIEQSRLSLESLFNGNIITAVKTSKGVVHMDLSYSRVDVRLSPLP